MKVSKGSRRHTPTIVSCVRPSERPKLIDGFVKGYLI